MHAVLVTGAAGSTGRRVTALLAQHPDVARVVALDRFAGGADVGAATGRVEARVGDLLTDDLRRALDGIDTVVHLAEAFDPDGGDPVDEQVSVGGLRRLLDACSDTDVHRLVVRSSATVYGVWAGNPVPLTESAPVRPNPELPYAVHRAEVERMAGDWARDRPDVAVSLLRPVAAAAPGELGWLGRALVGELSLRTGDTDPPLQLLHLDDLAAAVVHAAHNGLRGPYNVAPDGWLSGEAARALAGPTARVWMPEGLAVQLSAWSWELKLSRAHPGLVPYTAEPWVVANDRLRATGWSPRHGNEDTLVDLHAGAGWHELPARRRQAVVLTGVGALLAGAVAAGAWLALRTRGRH